jgi:polygalacturonase
VTSVSVRDLGAVGDGTSLDTDALQSAIDRCASTGGGTVEVPSGRYRTGAIVLRDDVTLHLDAGATLVGSERPQDYPLVRARWEGRERETHAPLIGGNGLRNVAITGRGTIDGAGAPWWTRHREGRLDHPRPRLVSLADSTNVLIADVTLTNSPSWTINPVRCENVIVDRVTIDNPHDSPNTDGINPDSCRYVRIANCYIDVGDDCITIKSGIETEAPELLTPCENIVVTGCTMVNGHGGVVIGSEMSGDVRNVVVANCVFTHTERGIRIKSRRGRGGIVEDVRVTNVIMRDVLCPFTMNLHYNFLAKGDPIVSDRRARPVDRGTPRVRHISFTGVTARDAHYAAAFLCGLPEMPIEDVAFADVAISLATEARSGRPEMMDGIEPMSRIGFVARHIRGLRLDRVEITGHSGDAFVFDDVGLAREERLFTDREHADTKPGVP